MQRVNEPWTRSIAVLNVVNVCRCCFRATLYSQYSQLGANLATHVQPLAAHGIGPIIGVSLVCCTRVDWPSPQSTCVIMLVNAGGKHACSGLLTICLSCLAYTHSNSPRVSTTQPAYMTYTHTYSPDLSTTAFTRQPMRSCHTVPTNMAASGV